MIRISMLSQSISKKGGMLSVVFTELMYLLAAVLIVVIILQANSRLSDQANKVEKYDSIVNYNALISQLYNFAKENSHPFLSNVKSPLPFSLSPDWIVVGFDRDYSEKIKSTCQSGWGESTETISKPKECGDDFACLCLYRNTNSNLDNNFDDYGGNSPHSCTPIQGVHKIVTYYCGWQDRPSSCSGNLNKHEQEYCNCINEGLTIPDRVWKNVQGDWASQHGIMNYADPRNVKGGSLNYAPLVYFGYCDEYSGEVRFGAQNLYVEMFKDFAHQFGDSSVNKGQTVAFIYPYEGAEQHLQERAKDLEALYPKGKGIQQQLNYAQDQNLDYLQILARSFLDGEERKNFIGDQAEYIVDTLYEKKEWIKTDSIYDNFDFTLFHKLTLLRYLEADIRKKETKDKFNELLSLAESEKNIDIATLGKVGILSTNGINNPLPYITQDLVQWMKQNEKDIIQWQSSTSYYTGNQWNNIKESNKARATETLTPEEKKIVLEKIRDTYRSTISTVSLDEWKEGRDFLQKLLLNI